MGLHPITITLHDGPAGPAIPDDFAGLSFERGPLNPGNAGVPGYLFDPANSSLVTLFRNAGLRNLRVGGGSVDQFIPAGTGRDGFTGVDHLFAFAAEAGVRVIYTFRLLNPRATPIADLESVNAQAAAYIWGRYREQVASFAIGNEPDWHDFHSYAGRPLDPAIREDISGVPGSAYPSYLATWRSFAAAVAAAAPGAPLTGPDTGAYSPMTWTPDPDRGVSWTERFAADERDSGQVADITQHLYVGGGPGKTSRPAGDQQHAVARMGARHRGRDPARGHHLHAVPVVLPEPSRRGGGRGPALPAHRVERLPRRCPGSQRCVRLGAVGAGLPALVGRAPARGREFPQQAVAAHRHDRAGPGRARRRLRGHPQGLRHQSVHPGFGGAGQAGGDRECGRRQPDRVRRRRGRLGLRHDHQQDPGTAGRGCGRDDRPARARRAGSGAAGG